MHRVQIPHGSEADCQSSQVRYVACVLAILHARFISRSASSWTHATTANDNFIYLNFVSNSLLDVYLLHLICVCMRCFNLSCRMMTRLHQSASPPRNAVARCVGGSNLFLGGPNLLSGGPNLLSGGPNFLLGGPNLLLGGPNVF